MRVFLPVYIKLYQKLSKILKIIIILRNFVFVSKRDKSKPDKIISNVMSQVGRLTVRKLSELQGNNTNAKINESSIINTNVVKNNLKQKNHHDAKNRKKTLQCTSQKEIVPNKDSIKKTKRSMWRKEPPANQTRLESYFKICPKNQWNSRSFNNCDIKTRSCKRLFSENDKPKCEVANGNIIRLSMECILISSENEEEDTKRNNIIAEQSNSKTCKTKKGKIKKEKTKITDFTISARAITKVDRKLVDNALSTLSSPSASINQSTLKRTSPGTMQSSKCVTNATVMEKIYETTITKSNAEMENLNESKKVEVMNIKISPLSRKFLGGSIYDGDLNNNNKTVQNVNKERNGNNPAPVELVDNNSSYQSKESNVSSNTLSTKDLDLEPTSEAPSIISAPLSHCTKHQRKPCPSYKIIEDTTFAVDAFQFGYLEGVTHYFLTHFHADHYIGLTRKFSYPIYMSELTGRLVQLFINLNKSYIRILPLNEEVIIDDTTITVTALDANHCPGAVMLLFKHLRTGKCVLHTGDFRATYEMEMLPPLWNHNIHTLYLDTTYIQERHAFCTQDDSVEKAKQIICDFQAKNQSKNILYVCGSYVIGKEKFWSALAEEFNWKVWSEENRYKALKALNNPKWNDLLVANVNEAQLHIIAMAKLNYTNLMKYFSIFEYSYDIILAIRPSGWEKNTRPKLNGKINIIGIEYSEHSNLHEMERFVRFLNPKQVISTVPVSRDLTKTSEIPKQWYNYTQGRPKREQQSRITNYMTLKKLNNNVHTIVNGARKSSCHLHDVTVSPLFTNIFKYSQKENTIGNDYDDDVEEVEHAEKQIEYVQRCITKVKNWLMHCTGETNAETSKVMVCMNLSDTAGMADDLDKAQSVKNHKKLLKRTYNKNRILGSDTTTIMNEMNTNEAKVPKKMTNITLHHFVNKEKNITCKTSIKQNTNLLNLNLPSPADEKLKLVNCDVSEQEMFDEARSKNEDQLFKTGNIDVILDVDADEDWL